MCYLHLIMSDTKSTKHDWIMSVSTGAMVITSAIMMYSGCQQTKLAQQQTRLANAAEERNAIQEERQTFQSKKELAETLSDIIELLKTNNSLTNVADWERCVSLASVVSDRLSQSLGSSYFLFKHPSQTEKWDEIRQRFGRYVHYEKENYMASHPDGYQNNLVSDFGTLRGNAIMGLMEIYNELKLYPLVTTEKKP